MVLPGVSNALAARVVADLGFPAAYITGAGIANTYLGIPDNGLVTLTELADHVAAIRDVFPGPLMVDADTGFGNAMNMVRTVKLLERAGADAIQIEDQVFPKRCGHFDGKEVIPAAEMVAKVKAAADARSDAAMLIVARTDAIATDGFEAAIARAHAYREAGADVTFVEAPKTPEQIADIPRRLPWPQIINIVLGGRTPELPNEKLSELGFAAVLYANVALQSARARHAARARRVAQERARSAMRRARGRFLRAPAAGRQGGVRRAGTQVQGLTIVVRVSVAKPIAAPARGNGGLRFANPSGYEEHDDYTFRHTPVLIVGAGPVGLALAGDLGWRGVPCTLIEKADGAIEQPKMDLIGVRTMEFCRRWGIADWVRDAPYPGDYPQDYIWLTALNGYELGREKFPGRALRALPAGKPAEARARAAGHVRSDPQAVRDVIRACRTCSTTPNWSRFEEDARRGARHRARSAHRRDPHHRGGLHGRHRRRRKLRARAPRHHHERQSGAHLHDQRDLPLHEFPRAARQGARLPLHLHRSGRHLAHHRRGQRRRSLPHVDRRHARQGQPHRGRHPRGAAARDGHAISTTRSFR